MVQETNKLATLIARLMLGDEDLLVQDYVDMVGEECIEVEYSIDDLVNLAFEHSLTTSHDFDLNIDLDDICEVYS